MKKIKMSMPTTTHIIFRMVFSHLYGKFIHIGTTLIRNIPNITNRMVVAII